MQKSFRAVLAATAFCLAVSHVAPALDNAPVTGSVNPDRPIQVQISQKQEPTPTWVSVADKFAWPIVILVGIVLFRKGLTDLVEAIRQRGADVSFGGLSLRLPKLESQVEEQSAALKTQQDKISEQSARVGNLIRFSMSWYIYKMLFDMKESQLSRDRYIYREDGSMNRNLRFLIDHGYVEEMAEWPRPDEDISGKVKITPSGDDVIAIRGQP